MFALREHSLLSLIIFVSHISDLPSPRVVLINESSTHREFKVRLRIPPIRFQTWIASSFSLVVLSLFPLFPNATTDLIVFLAWWNLFRAKFPGEEKAKTKGEEKCHIVGRTVAALSFEKRYISNRITTELYLFVICNYTSLVNDKWWTY